MIVNAASQHNSFITQIAIGSTGIVSAIGYTGTGEGATDFFVWVAADGSP